MSSASTTIDVGPGLIIIASTCVISLVLSIVLSRVDGNAKLVGVVLIPLAIIISLGLWFAPRESLDTTKQVDVTKYDPGYYARWIIFAVMILSVLISLALYAWIDVLEPIYARPLKKLAY